MAKKELILCDTNILIGLIRQREEIVERFASVVSATGGWDRLCISIITYGEILPNATKRERRRTLQFLNSFRILELDRRISNLLREIFNETYYHERMMADALIAATAITYDMPLWTLNKKDFQHKGIRFIHPRKRKLDGN
jgi:predicted nucleic acid-binding protein